LPEGESFSELYVLGPEQMAENLPFNVITDQTYLVYLGVGNHLGASTDYICYIKLRNQTDPLPNTQTTTASPLNPLYEYRTIIQDGKNWTAPMTFSLSGLSVSNNQTLLQSLTINDKKFNVDKIAQFNQDNNGYYYQILIELWAYNPDSEEFQYQNRYVNFWLNATATG
jgi:uncharacterized membrane protein